MLVHPKDLVKEKIEFYKNRKDELGREKLKMYKLEMEYIRVLEKEELKKKIMEKLNTPNCGGTFSTKEVSDVLDLSYGDIKKIEAKTIRLIRRLKYSKKLHRYIKI